MGIIHLPKGKYMRPVDPQDEKRWQVAEVARRMLGMIADVAKIFYYVFRLYIESLGE